MGFFKTIRWGLVDCLTGEIISVEPLPFEIGSHEAADLPILGPNVQDRHCALIQAPKKKLRLTRRSPEAVCYLNGQPSDDLDLDIETDFTLQIGTRFFLLRGDSNFPAWSQTLDCKAWSLFDPDSGQSLGPMALESLSTCARDNELGARTVASVQGSRMGFYLRSLLAAQHQRPKNPQAPPEPPPLPDASEASPGIQSSDGAFTCPVCWLKFDAGDIMSVAVHDSLRGDTILGPDAPRRFHATQYNNAGQALDAMGLPCVESACPHCRRVLPPGFLDVQHHIFSIVGDQSAGKSYYLSVLAKTLPLALLKNFDVVFRDADPTGNALLNDMKQALFSARSPREARLVKTQLEGSMYERLPRFGRTVALPRPFVFFVQSRRDPASCCSAIFYDNAGEHFQPGRDSADSPGAQHVASSAGILFLFDPFNHPEFRRRMADHDDPQLERPLLDQQDIILTELNVRVKKLLNLGIGTQIDRPLAVVVGKCDAWMHWLGDPAPSDPSRVGALEQAAVEETSARVRKLLMEVAPTVVSNAENLSNCVRYFPASSFGHPPLKIESGDFAPDPRRLNPILPEAPVLWLLSRVTPALVPTR